MRARGWFRIRYSAWAPLAVVLVSGCGGETVGPPRPTPGLSIQLAPTNSGDQQTATVATTLLNPLRVLVRRGSAAAPGTAVRWTVIGDTLGVRGSLSATSTTTDATGVASVNWTLGQVAGPQRAMASISDPAQSADSSVAFTAIANPGPASRLRFSVNPTNTFAARPVTPAVRVSAVDAFDNSTGSAATITVVLGSHSGTGVLSGTTGVDAVSGVATFADLSIDQAGTGYTLSASATGLTGSTSAAFDVVTPGSGEIAFVSARDGNNEIYLMNADGSGLLSLTHNPASDDEPAWSPDGSKIAFSSTRDGNREIYVMNADGSGQRNLTNNPAFDGEAAWSPDGTRIAFNSDRNGNCEDLYVMNADGSGLQKLTNSPGCDFDPAWSPNGTRIAFISYRDGNYEIYVMNADGSGQVNLTNNPADDGSSGIGSLGIPAWSPDGSKIAFPSDREGNFKIHAMSADGSGVSRLTNSTLSDRSPVWSPDGTRLAFVRVGDCGFHCLPRRDIYVMNADGSAQVNLTNNTGHYDSPAWSPDGSKIAFWNYGIYVMNADGSGQVNFTNNGGVDEMPAWRPR
jgi:Tol biopolymer transport system component